MSTHIALVNTASIISAKLDALKRSNVIPEIRFRVTTAQQEVEQAQHILQRVFDVKPYPVQITEPIPTSGIKLVNFMTGIIKDSNGLVWDLEQMKLSPPLKRAVTHISQAEATLCV